MSASLAFERVRFSFGDLTVLDGVDFVLEAGEAAALLGANGGGKTTLLRLAAGALHPDRGRVLLDGTDVRRYGRRQLALRVSALSQQVEVPGGWMVREAVSIGRTPHVPLLGSEGPADREAVDRALALAQCGDLAERAYDSLSGGQQQRVAVAMALAQEPRLLLLDEPTAHLDLRYRAALLDTLAELHARLGLSVLAAMHDPSLAALYFPRLILLAEGRILADGPPERVLTESLLERVYGVPVRVTTDEVLGVPQVAVLPARMRSCT